MEIISKIVKKDKRPLLTTGAVEMIGHSIKVNTQKAKEVLGYTPIISLEQGLQKTFQWLKTLPIENARIK